MKTIKGFNDEYRWLSNFYRSPITFNRYDWPTVEHAYVAHKARPKDYVRVANRVLELTAGQAKRYGRTITMREDFDYIKLFLMQALQVRKYGQNKELLEKLLETGDAYIEETNTWGDTFWGVCEGIGENHLGRIIMGVRDYHRAEAGIQIDEHAWISELAR